MTKRANGNVKKFSEIKSIYRDTVIRLEAVLLLVNNKLHAALLGYFMG